MQRLFIQEKLLYTMGLKMLPALNYLYSRKAALLRRKYFAGWQCVRAKILQAGGGQLMSSDMQLRAPNYNTR